MSPEPCPHARPTRTRREFVRDAFCGFGGLALASMVDRAFRLALGRRPTATERALSLEYLESQPRKEFALAVFNLNGFLYAP